MPLYDYKCGSCGHEFRKLISMSARKEPEKEGCPKCQKVDVKQQLGYAGLADPVSLGRTRPNSDFNQVLKNIKKGSPGSTVRIHGS